jgi:3-hydroxyisobutyrate dehydrogenase-like beta-hydroxyacid dehydrogenase
MLQNDIGFLHPGAMGISLAASAQNSGFRAHWASAGRSPATQARAHEHQLIDAGDLKALVRRCQALVSICPPHAAEDVARQVSEIGFGGLYLDANAISPLKAQRIGAVVTAGGAEFVDGGVLGGPAWEPGRTWLYLSGRRAEDAARFFRAGPLETERIGPSPGQASALKMCFAAYTKGSTALLCAILGAADSLEVRDWLEVQWARNGSDFADQARERARRVTAKAWRFQGEMEEIAATFEMAHMPGGFHTAAAEIYRRLSGFKNAQTPELEAVLDALKDISQESSNAPETD